MPCDEILSSTVVAPNPADAGAMATAFSVLTPEESGRVAAALPGSEYLLIAKAGKRIMSPGFAALMAAAAPTPAPAPPDAWSGMELTISVELARLDARARRP